MAVNKTILIGGAVGGIIVVAAAVGGAFVATTMSSSNLASSAPVEEKIKLNGWQQKSDDYYYYKDDVAQTGWIQDNVNWYYLGSDEKMRIGWIQDQNKWYYLNSDGAMATNITIDGCYLNENGIMIDTPAKKTKQIANESTANSTNSTETNDVEVIYKEGTIINLSGTLRKIDWVHPGNGKNSPYYVLELDAPATFNVLVNGERFIRDGVNEIQVTANFHDNFKNQDALEAQVNQHVNLKGEIWGGAGTSYYHKLATLTWL